MRSRRSTIIAALLVGLLAPWGAATEATAASPSGPHDVDVLEISFYPPAPDGKTLDRSGMVDEQGPRTITEARTVVQKLSRDVAEHLTAGTRFRGYANPAATPSLVFQRRTSLEFVRPLPLRTRDLPCQPEWSQAMCTHSVDYESILQGIDICHYVRDLGIDEVWLWTFASKDATGNESTMQGPYGDISNSYREGTLPSCGRTYRLYDYNYNRGTGTMLENHGHQIEAELDHLSLKELGDTALFRGEFQGWSGRDFDHKPTHGCGNVHNPPNARWEYDRANAESSISDCLDWQPDGGGSSSSVSCSTWNSCAGSTLDNDGSAWITWWMQSIPGQNNKLTYRGDPLSNWWDIYADFDAAMKSGHAILTPAPRAITSASPLFEVKTLEIAYLPVTAITGSQELAGADATSLAEWRMTSQTLARAVASGSTYHGYSNSLATPVVQVDIVDRLTSVGEIPRTKGASPAVDYKEALRGFDICHYVRDLGVRQVWLWSRKDGLVTDPGHVSSRYGDFSTLQPQGNDLPSCGPTYTLVHLDYHGDVTGPLRNIIEEFQSELNFAATRVLGSDAVTWRLFAGRVDASQPMTDARCGTLYLAPNSPDLWDFTRTTSVPSDCEDWTPQGSGASSAVSCRNWGCDGIKYLIWMLQNMPGPGHAASYNGKWLGNWWAVYADFDGTLQRGEAVVASTPTGRQNTNLRSLTIDGRPVSFTSISPILAAGTTKVDVNATPQADGAIVTTVGSSSLHAGENVITVEIKSADGSRTGEYRLLVRVAGGDGSAAPTPTTTASATPTGSPTPTVSPTPSTSPTPTTSPTPSRSPSATPKAKRVTITCVKGKLVKKVTGLKPRCPKGYVRH